MNENEIITDSFQDEVVQAEPESTSEYEEHQEILTEVEHVTEVEVITEVEHVTEVENLSDAESVTDVTTSYVTGVSTTPDIYQRIDHLEKNSDGQLLFLGGVFFLLIIWGVSGFLKSLIF